MGNAIWLFFALPEWYFSAVAAPLSAGDLSLVPAIGSVFLLIGLVWGIMERQPRLLFFLALPFASQILVFVAGFMRGAVVGVTSQAILWAFLLLQFAAVAYLVLRMKPARLPAVALGVFALSYAWFASFVATMAFNDTWI